MSNDSPRNFCALLPGKLCLLDPVFDTKGVVVRHFFLLRSALPEVPKDGKQKKTKNSGTRWCWAMSFQINEMKGHQKKQQYLYLDSPERSQWQNGQEVVVVDPSWRLWHRARFPDHRRCMPWISNMMVWRRYSIYKLLFKRGCFRYLCENFKGVVIHQ